MDLPLLCESWIVFVLRCCCESMAISPRAVQKKGEADEDVHAYQRGSVGELNSHLNVYVIHKHHFSATQICTMNGNQTYCKIMVITLA